MSDKFTDKIINQIDSAEMFRYRDKKDGKLQKYTKLIIDGQTFWLHKTVETQFYSHIGLKIRDLENIREYSERNKVIQENAKTLAVPIVLRMFTDDFGNQKIYAVVSTKFTHFGHKEVFGLAEETLKRLGIDYWEGEIIRTNSKIFKTYEFPKMIISPIRGDDIACGLRLTNSAKGLGSIGAYGYHRRLICSNGMTANKGTFLGGLRHIGDKLRIQNQFQGMIEKAIATLDISEKIIEARKIGVVDTNVWHILNDMLQLSQYEIGNIINRFKNEEKNVWGLVNAITFIASRNITNIPTKQLMFQQKASKLLENPMLVVSQ